MAGSISIWGLGGGSVNTQDLIDLELYSLEMAKLPYVNRQKELTTLQTSYKNFKSALQDFVNMLSSFSLYRGLGKETTYSEEGYVKVNASSSAISGSYSIEVNQLATRHQLQTQPSSDFDVSVPLEKEGTIKVNNVEIEITSDMSAADILQRISNSTAGVSAYAIKNTMFMVSNTAGDKEKIQLVDSSNGILESIGFMGDSVLETEPQDAIFKINDVEVTSKSNTVTDILPGVTLELTKATKEGPIEFTIDNSSSDDIFDKISEFVDAYNKARSTLTSYVGVDGALSGKAATRSLQNVLTSMFRYERDGMHPFTIGLSGDKEGVLSLNEEKLKEEIAKNPDAIKDFFFGIGGLTGKMNTEMNKVFGASGIVTKELDNISAQLTDIDKRIVDIDKRNAILEEAIIDKYAAFEVRIGSLNLQLQMMQSLIKELSKSNRD